MLFGTPFSQYSYKFRRCHPDRIWCLAALETWIQALARMTGEAPGYDTAFT